MAINKKAIIDAVFQGTGIEAKNLLPPDVWSAKNDIVDYPYAPDQARALLKRAGFANGMDIDLWAIPVQRPYNPNARRMAEMIQADWDKIGVRTKIVSYEWDEYFKRVKDGEHQAALMGWTTATGDHQKRVELYQQAQVIMHDQVPAVMIVHSTIFEPVCQEVNGYEIDPFGKHIFYQVDLK